MLAITSDLTRLDALLNWWEWAEYTAEAVVIIGCAGEFVAEFTNVKTEPWRHKLGRLSLLLLIAGLAIELGALVRTNILSGQEIALLNGVASDADERAGLASERAAKAEERTAGILALVQPRYLTRAQEELIGRTLTGLSGQDLLIGSLRYDAEAGLLAKQLKSIFNRQNIG